MFGRSAKRVYLDFAATTPLVSEARKAWEDASAALGNPSSIHSSGIEAHERLERARAELARELSCKSGEVYFTSGATESNNLAILGAARAKEMKGAGLSATHWVTSSIEHASVLNCFHELARRGARVSFVPPEPSGRVSATAVAAALLPETVLVSVGWANNEIGVVQPLSQIARAIRAYEKERGARITFHTDAGQAPLYKTPSVHTLGVDALSLGAHKLYGPHGVGALYLSAKMTADKRILPLFLGGGQEEGLRPGTEDVPGVAGFAASFALIARERDTEAVRVKALRDELAKRIRASIPDSVINGDLSSALPHMVNLSLPEMSGEYAALALDAAGIEVSTKSACHEGEEKGSHVISALEAAEKKAAVPWRRAASALRFSLGRTTTMRDIERAAEALAAVAAQMARMDVRKF